MVGVRFRHGWLLSLLVALSLTACQRQAPPAEPAGAAPGLAEDLLQAWQREADKLMEMAEDFPTDKYNYKPNPEVRTFGEQLLHVAAANYFFLHAVRGEAGEPEHLSHEQYRTKGDIVDVLRKSFQGGASALRQMDDATLRARVKHPFADRQVSRYSIWLSGVMNAAEHYGQLVVYYRNNGLVPPASRR